MICLPELIHKNTIMRTPNILRHPVHAMLLPLLVVALPMVSSGQPGWYLQTSPLQEDLVSVSFADTLNGWAVTGNGTVIQTTDGGLNWQVQQTLDRFLPEKIFFQDDQTGWLAGVDTVTNDTAYILKTVDGGSNWDTSYVQAYAKLFDIFFINDTMGWVVGFAGDTLGLRLHTLDGGETWDIESGINVMDIYTSVHFRDTERGDICGPGPVMMHTSTGGRGPSPWALEIYNLKEPMYDLVNVGEVYGCMVGANGKLFFTKDKWTQFIEEDYPDGDTLWTVDAIEPLGFWIAGGAGTILFVGYNDFLGLTIDDQSMDIAQDLVDLDAVDDAHAWAVGEGGTILHFGWGTTRIEGKAVDALQIFPNPASDHIMINHIVHGTERLELYSLEGKLRKTLPLQPGQNSAVIDLRGLAAGTYILKAGAARHRIIIIDAADRR
jgi:photosystem II stability/assembly factor-like uncharacterized protein